MVFQQFGLLPWRNVRENVGLGLELAGISKTERHERVNAQLELVGLADWADRRVGELSGGMQQRVGLARALCTDPEVLLMDEAFSALDPLIRTQMQDQLIDIQARLHKTIVFITHDLDEALRLGDRIAILKDGALSQIGTPAEILLSPVDDYVRAFVRDVNRGRVLTVGNCMQPPKLRFSDETLAHALSAMQSAGEQVAYVSEGDRYLGAITRAGLEGMTAEAAKLPVASRLTELPALGPGTALNAALKPALASEYPLPVVDGEGRLAGVLSKDRISQLLSPPEKPN